MRAELLIRGTAASRAVSVVLMPARNGIAALADVADCQRRDGFPQPVIRRKKSLRLFP